MAGIRHGNRGRVPAHAFPDRFKKRVISLVQRRYPGFNFSHLSEMLEEEEGIRINRETLRLGFVPWDTEGRYEGSPSPKAEEAFRTRWTDALPRRLSPCMVRYHTEHAGALYR